MLIPNCRNGASRLSKLQPEPKASWTAQPVSPTLTTNQPSEAGFSPESVCSSRASVVISARSYVGSAFARGAGEGTDDGRGHGPVRATTRTRRLPQARGSSRRRNPPGGARRGGTGRQGAAHGGV